MYETLPGAPLGKVNTELLPQWKREKISRYHPVFCVKINPNFLNEGSFFKARNCGILCLNVCLTMENRSTVSSESIF
jgi:hypothetical protein